MTRWFPRTAERLRQGLWCISAGMFAACSGPASSTAPKREDVAAAVRWIGRYSQPEDQPPTFAWSGSGFELQFEGPSLSVVLDNEDAFLFHVWIDDRRSTLRTSPGRRSYALARALPNGPHVVRVLRQTEGVMGDSKLLGLLTPHGRLLPPRQRPDRFLEVIGDSISCGYGSLGLNASCPFSFETESHSDTYAALTARSLSADLSTIAVSGRGVARNVDNTTVDTLPMLYDRAIANDASIAWPFARAADAVIILLGTNDFAAGDPGFAFEDEYIALLERVRALYPQALIVCALGPLIPEDARLRRWRERLDRILEARKRACDTNIARIEFPVAQQGDWGCDYHPNVQKHAAMAAQLTALLRERLGW